MPPVDFEPTISAGERPQTYALDRAATGTGDDVWPGQRKHVLVYNRRSMYQICTVVFGRIINTLLFEQTIHEPNLTVYPAISTGIEKREGNLFETSLCA